MFVNTAHMAGAEPSVRAGILATQALAGFASILRSIPSVQNAIQRESLEKASENQVKRGREKNVLHVQFNNTNVLSLRWQRGFLGVECFSCVILEG